MLEFEEYKVKLNNIRPSLDALQDALKLEAAGKEIEELEKASEMDGFWNDVEKSRKVQQRLKALKSKSENYASLCASWDDMMTLCEMAIEEDDDSMLEELQSEFTEFESRLESTRLSTLLTGDYDANNAILTFHAGAGGTEAQDWTSMLYRMYTRYCERMGFTVKLLDLLDGDEAGIKSVTFEVSGDHVYGYLRGEKGVHRLVRISPFDANARRHTSFASLDVAPMLDEDDSEIEIDMKYVRVDTYHSSGAGGQNVNKTSSAVRMTYVKDDVTIVVSCQTERDQVQNRATCIKMLKAKLLELRERSKEQEMADIKGEMKKIEWGSQIRSYVFQPYTMVKDHRTNFESGNIDDVMDGNLEGFTTAYLKMQ